MRMTASPTWLVILSLFSFSVSAFADDKSPARTISVTGTGTVQIVPDKVSLYVSVRAENEKLEPAKQEADAIAKKVMAIVKEYRIEAKDVRTAAIEIDPIYNNYNQGVRSQLERIGYRVDHNIAITLRDLSRFEALLTALLEAGVNVVHRIEFETSKRIELRGQARQMALRAAKEKAELMAATLGQKVGQPLTIVEEPGRTSYGAFYRGLQGPSNSNVYIQSEGGAALGEEGAVALGEIGVQATVSVTFTLE